MALTTMFQWLRWRVPFFVCAMVALILATLLAATHREMQSTLMRAARDRASATATQLADLVNRSLRTNLDEANRLAATAAIRALAADPTPDARDNALKELTPAPGLRRLEIWSESGSRLLEIATPGQTATGQRIAFPAEPAPTAAGISMLRVQGELAYIDATSEIHDGATPPRRLGYLRRYGRISFTGSARNFIAGEGIIRIGSVGGAWIDMFTATTAAPTRDRDSDVGEHRTPDGQRWVGATVPIDAAPLIIFAGYSRDRVVAPGRRFMRNMIAFALVSIAITVGVVTLLSVRIARRVTLLTDVAHQMAEGDYSKRVPSGRADEIGRLSTAFNEMADRVEQVRNALQAGHERTQFSLIAAQIGVWESFPASGRMICSESIALARGLPVDATPRTVDEFLAGVHPDDRPSLRRILEGRASEGRRFTTSYRTVRQDGSTRANETKGRVQLDDRGQPASVLGVSADVTEQRQLEAQLRQAQKMEAVGQLAGGVAHDFNNLLTAIMGHGNLALDDLPAHHHVRENIIGILDAGERAAGLTRQLLAFSRRQVMQLEVVAVNAIITNIDTLLRRLIGEQVHIALDLGATEDAVKVDPGQLEQVLMNLAVNARDAMPDGGTLTIATSNVVLDATYARQHPPLVPGAYLLVAVSDTGVGMDADTQTRLFEPFFTTKPPGKGTGLGLATVYGIVTQSGGVISVSSERGRGATFKVYLPTTRDKPAARKAATEHAAGAQGTETILVVEDNPHVKAIATRVLSQIGYRVLAASTGEEALAVLETAGVPVDLVLSDVIMPGMTGPELYRQLAGQFPGLRVLFTSGYSRDAIERHGVLEPGTMFIEKPYLPGVLAQKVRDALEQ